MADRTWVLSVGRAARLGVDDLSIREVTIEDDEPTGTVVSVTLTRASERETAGQR